MRPQPLNCRLAGIIAFALVAWHDVQAQAPDTLGRGSLFLAAETRVSQDGRVLVTHASVVNRAAVATRLSFGAYCPIALRVYTSRKRNSLLWDGATRICPQVLRVMNVMPHGVVEFNTSDSVSKVLGDSIPPAAYHFTTVFRFRSGFIEIPSDSGELRRRNRR
jgi:hypothetical protein